MKLINMDKEEWRQENLGFKDTFRSDKAYKCNVCHIKTNLWIMGPRQARIPFINCPGEDKEEHQSLERYLHEIEVLDARISDVKKYFTDSDREAEIQMRDFNRSREFYLTMISKIRDRFKGMDDVKGKIKSKIILYN